MARLRLLCFDLDDTLWHAEPVLLRAEQVTWQWLLERVPQLDMFCTASDVRAHRAILLRNRPAYVNDLTALRRDSMRATLLAAGIGDGQATAVADEAIEVFLELRCQVSFFPGAREALVRLRSRYKLAALTNGNADLTRMGAGALFDVVLSAASVGRAKPEPAMFQRALAESAVTAACGVHIGDHPKDDVLAARAVGMAAVWANPLALPRPDVLPADVPTLARFDDLDDLVSSLEDVAR